MVKTGYKQTEIGVLPEDWDTISFENCFSILPNNTLSRAELNSNGGEIRNIHYGDILVKYPAVLDCSAENLPYVNKANVAKASKGFLRDGDLVMADTAEDTIVGKSTEVISIGDSKVVAGLHTIPCRPKNADVFTPKWLGYFINHSTYHDQLIPYITGIKVSSVSKSAIFGTVIAVPPKPEQEAIAAALSDMDALIDNLEKLIAKKKAIKQGAMQELLTGKRRLPGVTGEWITMKVENIISRFATGLNPRQNFILNSGGMNYYVTIKNFRNGVLYLDDNCDRVDDVALQKINERSDLKKNDLLFSSIGRIGDAYLIRETPINWNINESVFALRPNVKVISPLMLFWLLSSESVKQKLVESTTGSTLKSIKLGHLKEIECTFPCDITEQEAIASILFDMDDEIEKLEKNLSKYKNIKSGMMSELLTGRIRLV